MLGSQPHNMARYLFPPFTFRNCFKLRSSMRGPGYANTRLRKVLYGTTKIALEPRGNISQHAIIFLPGIQMIITATSIL